MENPFEEIITRLERLENQLARIELAMSLPKETDNIKKLVTYTQLAKELQVTRQTISKWRKEGWIKAVVIGGKIYFDINEITEDKFNRRR